MNFRCLSEFFSKRRLANFRFTNSQRFHCANADREDNNELFLSTLFLNMMKVKKNIFLLHEDKKGMKLLVVEMIAINFDFSERNRLPSPYSSCYDHNFLIGEIFGK